MLLAADGSIHGQAARVNICFRVSSITEGALGWGAPAEGILICPVGLIALEPLPEGRGSLWRLMPVTHTHTNCSSLLTAAGCWFGVRYNGASQSHSRC